MEGADSLKAKVAQANPLLRQKYKVDVFYHDTGVAQSYARSSIRGSAVSVITCILLVWMGVEVDTNAAPSFKEADMTFTIIFWLFTIFFIVDITIRFLAFKRKANSMKDSCFVFESLLTYLLFLHGIISYTISESSTGLNFLWYVQMLRFFLMANEQIPELWIILKGLLMASRSVFFTLCLFTTMLYMFAIIFTREAGGSSIGDQYFATVPETMHVLLLHGALMSGYAEFANDLQAQGFKGLEALLFCFTLISVVLIAVMLGIVCMVLNVVSETEKQRLTIEYMRSHINTEVGRPNADDDASISRKEFEDLLQRSSMCQLLKAIGVGVFSVVDALDAIFGNENDVMVADLVESIMQCSTEGAVTKQDLLLLKNALTAKSNDSLPIQFKEEADPQSNAATNASSKKIQKVVQESLTLSMQAVQAAMKNQETVDFTQIDVTNLTKAIERMSLPGQL